MLCSFKSNQENDLELHKKNDHAEKSSHEYCCEICSFNTKQKVELETHSKKEHQPKRKWICDECKQEVQSEEDLSQHKITKHGENVNQHLKAKCDFLEEEIAKERSVHDQNKVLVERQTEELKRLKKEVDSANKRTMDIRN